MINQFIEGSVLMSVVTLPPAPELCKVHPAKACLHDAAAPSGGVTRKKSRAPTTTQTTKPPFPHEQQLLLFPEVTTFQRWLLQWECFLAHQKHMGRARVYVFKARGSPLSLGWFVHGKHKTEKSWIYCFRAMLVAEFSYKRFSWLLMEEY